jgi:hypothetical protein
MKNKVKLGLCGMLLISLGACRTRSQQWVDGLSPFSKQGDTTETVELLKLKAADTSSLNYSVRIYPSKQWLVEKKDKRSIEMNYEMDSCFYIRNSGKTFRPVMIQPIANGLADCFEYMVSFDLEPSMEGPKPVLFYRDKFITKNLYSFQLNSK